MRAVLVRTSALLCLVAACNEDTVVDPNARLRTMSKQVTEPAGGTVGRPVTPLPAVRITTASGQPVPGVSVTFAVASGGGSVAGANQVTDANGVATVGGWILGTTAGLNTLSATTTAADVTGGPITFNTNAIADVPSRITKTTGDTQTGTAGQGLSQRPTVRVTDAFNNPVAGVQVSFNVTGGGGSVSPVSVATDVTGTAATTWVLGPGAGANSLNAVVAGSNVTTTFLATSSAAQAANVVKVQGDDQSTIAGQNVGTPPSVRVTDAFGNPVAGVTVTFTASAGGSVTGGTQTTNALGVATVGAWRVSQNTGPNTLTALATAPGIVIGGGNPATFFATSTLGPPASLVRLSGDNQTASAGRTVANPPSVRVVDAFGNAIPDVQVNFTVTSGGGQVSPVQRRTDANGVATLTSWTLGTAPGQNTATATVAGTNITTTFTATGVVGAPARVVALAGQVQAGTANSPVGVLPSVRVTDANDVPVPGVTVNFVVVEGSGTVTGATQTTNANGVATLGGWTLGGFGTNAVAATVVSTSNVSGNPVIFTATVPGGGGGINAPAYAGQWDGSWTTNASPTTGAANFGTAALTVTVDQSSQTIGMVLDLNGSFLAGGDPPADTFNGSYTAAGFTVGGASSTFGQVSLTFNSDGSITGTGTSPTNTNVSRYDFSGSSTARSITLNYTITFANGQLATGTIQLNR